MGIKHVSIGKVFSIYQEAIRWQMSCGVALAADLPVLALQLHLIGENYLSAVPGTGPCVRDYVIRYSAGEVIGRSRLSYLLTTCQCVFPLISHLLSHVLSSHLRTWKGPHCRRLPRPRPRLHRRRRLDLLSLLYCYNSGEHKS